MFPDRLRFASATTLTPGRVYLRVDGNFNGSPPTASTTGALFRAQTASALDPATETAICRNLKDLAAKTGLTIIAISHRPAWVNAANRVYHLERSQVSEIAAEAPLEPAS